MRVNIYKTAIFFFIIQTLLIGLLLNNNYMKRFSYFQSPRSDLVELIFGFMILFLNIAALIVVRYLNKSGQEAEQFKTTALKSAHMIEQNRIYRQHHHDLKNHLSIVLGLLKQGKYAELEYYLDSYQDAVNDALLRIETGLDEIDVLISAKVQSARSKEIKVELKVESNINSSRKHILELVTILGNVLDNALEAVQEFDEPSRIVSISIRQDPLEYIFEIANPVQSSSIKNTDKLFEEGFSTKQTGTGQGLFIVKRLTEKLNGHVTVTISDGCFTIKIEIPKHRLQEG